MITIDFRRRPLKAGDKVLDIGCGTGRHLGAAVRFADVTVVGADLDRGDLAEAGRRLQYHEKVGEYGGGPWGLMAADAGELPLADQAFDLVIASEVLEHIPDHKKAVAEFLRVLKPGGDLVISVPRSWPERICWRLSADYYSANGGHVRIYREMELIALVEGAGAELWSRHYAHGLHTPYWWLKCLAGPTRTDRRLVNKYHELLVWDLMKRPRLTRVLERLCNPFIGKSLVLYFRKN